MTAKQTEKRISTSALRDMKKKKKKITMLTAYDFPTAKILDRSGIDIVLVGDSLGNVVLGYENTLPVTVENMVVYSQAVRRAVKRAMMVIDMPFMSYQISRTDALVNASRFIKEGGADGVKIEGDVYIDAIKTIIDAGIPVMGHLGFTPQLVNQIGGYRVQGRTAREASSMIESAKKLQRAGVFALVLEMVPRALAGRISKMLKIPVIGIGAGPDCDGQVLVTNDMIGFCAGHTPRFAKRYADVNRTIKEAVGAYIWEVHSGKFPDEAHSF